MLGSGSPRHRLLTTVPMVVLWSFVSACLADGQSGDAANAALPADAGVATSDQRVAERFRAAAALENRELFDLAVQEWAAIAAEFPGDPLAVRARFQRGVCLFQLGRFSEAQHDFQRLVDEQQQLDPQLAEQCYAHRGLAEYNLGHDADGVSAAASLDAAIETFDQQLMLYPNGPLAAESAFYRGEALYARGRLDAAADACQAALKVHPQHPRRAELLHALGVCQQELERLEAAAATLAQFLAEFPQHELAADAQLRRGESLLSLGRPEEAEACLATAAATTDFVAADRALDLQAQCRFAANDFAGAAKRYAQLVDRFPSSPLVIKSVVAAGGCCFRAGNLNEAQKWLDRAEKLSVDTLAGDDAVASELAHWQARMFIAREKPSEAIEVLDKKLAGTVDTQWRPQLELDRADALFDTTARRAESVAAYAAVSDKNAGHELAPRAAYLAAHAALDVGDGDAACEYSAAFLARYPSHDLAADARQVAAEAQLQQAAYADAARAFMELMETFPQNASFAHWTVRHGHSLMLAGNYGEAIRRLENKLEAITNTELRAEAALVLGRCYLEIGKTDQAADVLAAAAALPRWPQADEALLTLAKAQHAQGQSASAIETLSELIRQFPDSESIDQGTLLRGELNAIVNKPQAALTDFERLIAHRPQSALVPQALLAKARVQVGTGDLAEAEASLDQILKAHRNHPLASEALLLRAAVRHQRGNFAGGIVDADVYIATDPPRPKRSDAIYTRGLCEVGLGQPAAAAETFSRIVNKDPQYRALDRVLYDLAWAYQEAGDAVSAAATFKKLAETYPESPFVAESWYHVGEGRYAARDYAAAAKSFWSAGERANDTELLEKSLHKLAWSCFEQQQFEAATEAFEKQLADGPHGKLAPDAAIMLGECHFQRQEFAAALAAFDVALKQDSSTATLRELALLHAGQAAAQLKEWPRSLELLDTCAREFSSGQWRDQIRYERGWALYHLERFDEAQQLFEAVAANNAEVLGARAEFMVGEVLFAKREFDDAVRRFFKVAYGYGDLAAPTDYHPWQAEAMFEAARCLEETKRLDAARQLYQELLDRYPTSEKAAYARSSLEEILRR